MLYRNRVHTSRETHCVSSVKISRSMLFKETVAVCCMNNRQNTDAVGIMQIYNMLKEVAYTVIIGFQRIYVILV
jgi:hypothetical protein